MLPVIRRWIRRERADSNRKIRYLPRRSTASIRSPSSSPAMATGSNGRTRRVSRMSTRSRRRPVSAGASAARTVSTSGSSGTGFGLVPAALATDALSDRFEHDRPFRRRLVRDRVGRSDLRSGLLRGSVVSRVHLRERLAGLDAVPALREAADPDGVVDRVLLRAAAGAEAERREADVDGADRGDEA